MNYRLQSREEKRSRTKKPLVFSLILLFVFVLMWYVAPKFLPNVSYAVATPIWSGVWNGAHALTGIFSSKISLEKENLALKEQLARIQIELGTFEIIKKENQELKRIFGRSGDQKFTLASVLIRPPQSVYDEMVIDVGTEEGIEAGDLVLASEHVLIGEVTESFSQNSRVRLYSSPDMKSNALLLEAGIPVETTGRGGGNLEVRLPRDIEVSEGDVLVSGISNTLLLGEVKHIIFKETDSFQTVLFTGPANIFNISSVFVYDRETSF